MKGVGSAPCRHIAPRSTHSAAPPPHLSPTRGSSSRQSVCHPPHPPTHHHHHRTPHPRPPRLQIKATAPLPVCVMGENQSYFYAGPCVTFPLRRYVVARGKGEGLNGDWMVESQPLLPPPKKKKKNVIERYVIVTISSGVKWYQRDISAEKKRGRRKGTSFN